MSNVIPRRKLGQQLEVSAIGLGCMGMSEFYGAADEATCLKVLNHAVDIGINFLDTADMYGWGSNERLLSQLLKTRRQEVVLATKFGNMRGPNGEFLGVNGRPESVFSACDASLERLGVEQIDLYYQHRVDPKVPIEDTMGAMSALVKQGKVRYLGLSEANVNTIRRAHAIHPIAALQSEYSLWTRNVAESVLPVCRELGIGYVAYSPLGRGFLTGVIQNTEQLAANDWRRNNPRFSEQNFKQNMQLVTALNLLATQRKVTPAQLALAWLLDQGNDIVPIPGTRKLERLEENAAATGLVLNDAERKAIAQVLASHAIAGDRYPAASMASLAQ